MTDEQIIKALDCCSKGNHCRSDCPYDGEDDSCIECTSLLTKDALVLINRRQAELERLEKENKALLLLKEKVRKEIVRIQTILINFMDEIYAFGNKNNVDTNSFAQIAILGAERDSAVEQIKAEAIKEFAERLKEQFDNLEYRAKTKRKTVSVDYLDSQMNWVLHEVSLNLIDNLVKEMTEPVKVEHNSLCETETYMGE